MTARVQELYNKKKVILSKTTRLSAKNGEEGSGETTGSEVVELVDKELQPAKFSGASETIVATSVFPLKQESGAKGIAAVGDLTTFYKNNHFASLDSKNLNAANIEKWKKTLGVGGGGDSNTVVINTQAEWDAFIISPTYNDTTHIEVMCTVVISEPMTSTAVIELPTSLISFSGNRMGNNPTPIVYNGASVDGFIVGLSNPDISKLRLVESTISEFLIKGANVVSDVWCTYSGETSTAAPIKKYFIDCLHLNRVYLSVPKSATVTDVDYEGVWSINELVIMPHYGSVAGETYTINGHTDSSMHFSGIVNAAKGSKIIYSNCKNVDPYTCDDADEFFRPIPDPSKLTDSESLAWRSRINKVGYQAGNITFIRSQAEWDSKTKYGMDYSAYVIECNIEIKKQVIVHYNVPYIDFCFMENSVSENYVGNEAVFLIGKSSSSEPPHCTTVVRNANFSLRKDVPMFKGDDARYIDIGRNGVSVVNSNLSSSITGGYTSISMENIKNCDSVQAIGTVKNCHNLNSVSASEFNSCMNMSNIKRFSDAGEISPIPVKYTNCAEVDPYTCDDAEEFLERGQWELLEALPESPGRDPIRVMKQGSLYSFNTLDLGLPETGEYHYKIPNLNIKPKFDVGIMPPAFSGNDFDWRVAKGTDILIINTHQCPTSGSHLPFNITSLI